MDSQYINPTIKARLFQADAMNARNTVRIENLTNVVRKLDQDLEHVKDKIEAFQAYLEAMVDDGDDEEYEEDSEHESDHSAPDEQEEDEDYEPAEETQDPCQEEYDPSQDSKEFAQACADLHTAAKDKQFQALQCYSPVYDERSGQFVIDLTETSDDDYKVPPSPMEPSDDWSEKVHNAMQDANQRYQEAKRRQARDASFEAMYNLYRLGADPSIYTRVEELSALPANK